MKCLTPTFKLAAVVALALVWSSPSAFAGYTALLESSLGDTKHTSSSTTPPDFGNDLYFAYSEKINDSWGFSAEMLEGITLKTHTFTHKYFRVGFKYKDLANLGSWKVNALIRYVLPTSESAGKSGSLGTLGFRPEISGKIGPVDLTTQLMLAGFIQRNKTAIVGTGGNQVFGTYLRIIPSVELTNTLFLASDFILAGDLKYDTLGTETSLAKTITHEVEFGYKGPVTKDVALSVVATTEGSLDEGTASSAKPYGGKTWNYLLRVVKEF